MTAKLTKTVGIAIAGAGAALLVAAHGATLLTFPLPNGTEVLLGLPAAHRVLGVDMLVPEVSALIPGAIHGSFFAPMGYTAMLMPWFAAWGATWLSMRLLSLLIYMVGGWLMFRVARLLDLETPLCWLATGLWLSDIAVWQGAHSGRPEMALVVLMLATLLLLLEAPRRVFRFRWLLASGACAGLACAVHPLGVVILPIGIGVGLIHERGLPWHHRWWWFVGALVVLWPFVLWAMSVHAFAVFRLQASEMMLLLGPPDANGASSFFGLWGAGTFTGRLVLFLLIVSLFGLIQGARAFWGWRWLLLLHGLSMAWIVLTQQNFAVVVLTPGLYLGVGAAWQCLRQWPQGWRQRVYIGVLAMMLGVFVSRNVLQTIVHGGALPTRAWQELVHWGDQLAADSDGYSPGIIDGDIWPFMAHRNLVLGEQHLYDRRWAEAEVWARNDLPWRLAITAGDRSGMLNEWLDVQVDWCLRERPSPFTEGRSATVHFTGDSCYTLAPQ